MDFPKTDEILDLSHTPACDLLRACRYPWEALPHLADFIRALSATLPSDEYDELAPGVFAHRTAKIAPTAELNGPAVIGAGSEIRHCAYLRGSVLIGEGCVVGNSTEIKNAVLFDGVQVPHYNYVGDAILGYRAHMGAGAVASNVRSDKANVTVKTGDERIGTDLRKFSAILGDFADVGCNSVLCPGSVVGRGCIVYPLSRVRGYVPANSIFKSDGVIVPKENR